MLVFVALAVVEVRGTPARPHTVNDFRSACPGDDSENEVYGVAGLVIAVGPRDSYRSRTV